MRRNTRDFFTVLLVLGVVVGVVLGVNAWRPLAEPDHPDEWDSRVAGLVDEVERFTDRDFEHPVTVVFQTDEEFEDDVRSDESDLSDADREEIAAAEAQGRALGLFSGETDLFEQQNDLRGSGILAYYSYRDKRIVIRLPEGETDDDVVTEDDIPIDIRVTVAHELTHALQDQLYDLDELQSSTDTESEASAVLALIEGHAVWVERQFVDDLSDDERQEYIEANTAAVEDFEDATADVAPILAASQSLPYVIGPALVQALDTDGGPDAIDAAFLENPPAAEDQVLMPSRYLDGDEPEEIEAPEAPDGTDDVGSGMLGPSTIYFLLATVMEPPAALTEVANWGNDAYVAYEDDDRVCIDARIVGDDDAATLRLGEVLGDWVAARPSEADATIDVADVIAVTVCDPGADVDQDVPGAESIDQIAGRSRDLAFVIDQFDDVPAAECLIDGIYTEFPASVFTQESLAPEVSDAIARLQGDCAPG